MTASQSGGITLDTGETERELRRNKLEKNRKFSRECNQKGHSHELECTAHTGMKKIIERVGE